MKSFLKWLADTFKIREIDDFLNGEKEKEPEPVPESIPEPTPEPAPEPEPDGKHSTEGSQRLLVKPASDNTGNLVILLPAKWNNSFRNVWIEANGKRYNDTGRRNINGLNVHNSNGNRRHIWFKQSGASIGQGVLVVELEGETKRLNYNFAVRSEKEVQ